MRVLQPWRVRGCAGGQWAGCRLVLRQAQDEAISERSAREASPALMVKTLLDRRPTLQPLQSPHPELVEGRGDAPRPLHAQTGRGGDRGIAAPPVSRRPSWRSGRCPSPWPRLRRSRGRTSAGRRRRRRPPPAPAARSASRRSGRPGWRSTSPALVLRSTPWKALSEPAGRHSVFMSSRLTKKSLVSTPDRVGEHARLRALGVGAQDPQAAHQHGQSPGRSGAAAAAGRPGPPRAP